MGEDYRFPGIRDFLAADGVRPSFAAKIPSTFLLSRVADALAAIPEARPEHRAELYAVAREGIAALSATLKTAVAAFDAVMAHCPPPPSEDDPPPAPLPTKAEARAAARAEDEAGEGVAAAPPAPASAPAHVPAGLPDRHDDKAKVPTRPVDPSGSGPGKKGS